MSKGSEIENARIVEEGRSLNQWEVFGADLR